MDHGKRQITKVLVDHVKELGFDIQLTSNRKYWRVLGRGIILSDLCLGKSAVTVENRLRRGRTEERHGAQLTGWFNKFRYHPYFLSLFSSSTLVFFLSSLLPPNS